VIGENGYSVSEYRAWEKSYLRERDKVDRKWDDIFRSMHGAVMPPPSDKIKFLIREGVPNRLRRKVWMHYSGAQSLMQGNPNVYVRMVAKETEFRNKNKDPSQKANEHIDVIERDLHRTFPTNIHFQEKNEIPVFDSNFPPPPYIYNTPLFQSLRRVLVAYSFFNSSLGYCQSLNYIVGLLLLFMPEEEAFWMLVTIIQRIMPEGMYAKNMSGTLTEMKVVMDIVKEKCKSILNRVHQGGVIELDMLISPWFLTMYINILPIESVLRVWDCLFYEGNKILYRTALAILKINEKSILKIEDPMEMVQRIQQCPKKHVRLPEAHFRCISKVWIHGGWKFIQEKYSGKTSVCTQRP